MPIIEKRYTLRQQRLYRNHYGISIYLACLYLVAAQVCYAAPVKLHLVKRILLSSSRHRSNYANVMFAKTGPGDFGEFYVNFQQGNLLTRNGLTADAGAGNLQSLVVHHQDYAGLGRKQLFLSSQMGRVYTHLYDSDGFKLRNLYSSVGGRVFVEPVKNSDRWEMIETWASYQYTDFDNLGTGSRFGKHRVKRVLVWRRGEFTPKFPGPTRIRGEK